MTRNVLSKLNFDAKTRKRAQWESFEFSVPAAGSVAVTNASYGDEKDAHTHAVNVEDGVPVGCSCKADEYQPGDLADAYLRTDRDDLGDGGDPYVSYFDGGQLVVQTFRGELIIAGETVRVER